MGTVDSKKPMPRGVSRNRSRNNYDFDDYRINDRRYSDKFENLNFYTHNFQENLPNNNRLHTRQLENRNTSIILLFFCSFIHFIINI
jgi:hypothetical protein